jgi:uncharacterized protein YndB with AHSA1/START domain
MARNATTVAASPEQVWEVLADPHAYGHWVVGSRSVRAADPGFPAPGTRFHHTVGIGPLHVADHTEVVEADAPRRLVLRAKARPLGSATVTLDLRPVRGGTRVVMVEDPAHPALNLLIGPLGHLAVRLRNAEALRRLRSLAEDGRPAARAA